jgi:hypothetical protein
VAPKDGSPGQPGGPGYGLRSRSHPASPTRRGAWQRAPSTPVRRSPGPALARALRPYRWGAPFPSGSGQPDGQAGTQEAGQGSGWSTLPEKLLSLSRRAGPPGSRRSPGASARSTGSCRLLGPEGLGPVRDAPLGFESPRRGEALGHAPGPTEWPLGLWTGGERLLRGPPRRPGSVLAYWMGLRPDLVRSPIGKMARGSRLKGYDPSGLVQGLRLPLWHRSREL